MPADITVVLPTRDRPEELLTAVRSILASSCPNFELVVVDQSSTDATRVQVEQLAGRDARVRVLRDTGVGSSRARNLGIAATQAGLVAFTDDDCVVAADWLLEIVAAFAADQSLGAICGAVEPGPHDTSEGFIVGYAPARQERLTGRLAKMRDAGIGANMAFRRSALVEVEGWDELLGTGGVFQGAGDLDLVYRMLAAGYGLLELPGALVVHHGFRDWNEGSGVIRGRFRGIGAAYIKHARLGDPVAMLLLGQQLWLSGLNVLSSVLRGKRPIGVGRILALLSGIRDGFAYAIDAHTRLYASGRHAVDLDIRYSHEDWPETQKRLEPPRVA